MFVVADEDKLCQCRVKEMEDGEIVPTFNLASFIQYHHFNWADAQELVDGGIGEHAQRAQNYFAIKE